MSEADLSSRTLRNEKTHEPRFRFYWKEGGPTLLERLQVMDTYNELMRLELPESEPDDAEARRLDGSGRHLRSR